MCEKNCKSFKKFGMIACEGCCGRREKSKEGR